MYRRTLSLISGFVLCVMLAGCQPGQSVNLFDRSGRGAITTPNSSAGVRPDVSESTNACSTTGFNGVRPYVASVGHSVQQRFNITTVYGKRIGDSGEHPLGRALDFMVYGDRATGDKVLAYLKTKWADYGIMYIIWEQRYYDSPRSTGRLMEDRGGETANHFDHVHVSFESTPGPVAPTC